MKSEYEQEIAYYEIKLAPSELYGYEEKIRQNLPVEPVVAGYLLGRSSPVFRDIECEMCKQKIRKGELWNKSYVIGNFGDFGWKWDKLHQACFDDALKKRQEGGE